VWNVNKIRRIDSYIHGVDIAINPAYLVHDPAKRDINPAAILCFIQLHFALPNLKSAADHLAD